MKVVADHTYEVTFEHHQFVKPTSLAWLGGNVLARAVTDCEIWLLADAQTRYVIAAGAAVCAAADQFCKETGRQIALKRAVQGLSRELRGSILYAYFTRHKTDHKEAA